MTCDTGTARSRIDRIYSNHHIADQLDRTWAITPLPWCRDLSDHRPISFCRRGSQRADGALRPLQPHVLKNEAWSQRTRERYHLLCQLDAKAKLPLRRMHLLKRTMRQVADEIAGEDMAHSILTNEDKLGWCLRFLRSAERSQLSAMERCAKAYPELRRLADARNPLLREQAGLTSVRKHAVELAKDAALAELREVHDPDNPMDEQQRARRREQLHVRLKRLLPGGSTSIAAIRTRAGDIVTEPSKIAAALRHHLGRGFRSKASG